jgi:hypothetical protein
MASDKICGTVLILGISNLSLKTQHLEQLFIELFCELEYESMNGVEKLKKNNDARDGSTKKSGRPSTHSAENPGRKTAPAYNVDSIYII